MDERSVGIPPARDRARDRGLLWFGVFGGALAWALRFGWSYLLVPVACREGTWILHLVAVVAVMLGVAAGVVAWREARRGETGNEPEDVRQRRVVLGSVGVILSGFFVAVTLFESVANLVVDPCLKAAGS